LERRVILEPGNASYACDRKTEFRVSHMTGGLSVFVASSFARESHAANVQNGAGTVGQSTGYDQQTRQ